jgi:hypothetical protein
MYKFLYQLLFHITAVLLNKTWKNGESEFHSTGSHYAQRTNMEVGPSTQTATGSIVRPRFQ